MKRKLIARALMGAPLGLAISTVMTLAISYFIGDGQYNPVVPSLVVGCGSELRAAALQTVCCLLYGAVWGGSTVIFEMERWSLLRQTVTHLLICSLSTFLFAYLLHWMERSAAGIALYFGIFFVIYLVIWLAQYGAIRKRIDALNANIRKIDGGGE